jgi:hypothetical protein
MSSAVLRSLRAAAVEVDEWVLTGFSRQREQVCSEGWPRRLARDFRNELVRSAVERVNDLGYDELLGCHLEPIGVALDGLEQRGATVSGRMSVCGPPSPTICRKSSPAAGTLSETTEPQMACSEGKLPRSAHELAAVRLSAGI